MCTRCKCIMEASKYKRCPSCREIDKRYNNGTKGKTRNSNRKASFTVVLTRYKIGADQRNIGWYLSDEYAKELFSQPCHYCGFLDLEIRCNGIDRTDNSQCYVPANTVSCCSKCNFAKGTLGYHEFIDLCVAVASNFPTQSYTDKCQHREHL